MTNNPRNIEETAATVETNSGDNVRASWSFSLHDVRSNLSHCSHESREILIACFLWSIDPKHPVSRPEFAQAIGHDSSTIYRIYSGKYVNNETRERLEPSKKLVDSARAWLARQRKSYKPVSDFILTPTAQRIWHACNLARESKSPVFLIGRSHIGKTWALEKYAADDFGKNTILVRMGAASGLRGMLYRFSEKCGVSSHSNTEELKERIKKSLSPDTLLIIDEVHLLQYTYKLQAFFSCLEVIREIYDESGCGMLLCGTELLIEKMRRGTHGEMEQLIRRGVHKFRLPTKPTPGDITAILNHHNIDFPVKKSVVNIVVDGQHIQEYPYDLIRQLVKDEGLKSITERLRYAEKLAGKKRQACTMEHFIEADVRIRSNRDISVDEWQ